MPYYKNKDLLFIHIPKTGGSTIETEIKKQTPQTLYSSNFNNLLPAPYNKKSLQHQFYTTLCKYKDKLNINFDNIKIFSIVRDPYDRIISDLFWYRLIRPDFNCDQVYNVIKNNYLNRNDLDNHNEPQYKYVTDENAELVKNIRIFKLETLNESNAELNKFIGFNINVNNITNKNRNANINKNNYSKYLNEKSISLINDFYKKDFELFKYTLK